MFFGAIKLVFLIGILQWNIPELWALTIAEPSRPIIIDPNYNQDCPANLTFSYCPRWRSCDDLSATLYWCVPGCVCPDGLILESSNSTNCIKLEQCENLPDCSSFEVYEQSGIDRQCPQEYNYAYPSAGCHCKIGYIRPNASSMCQLGPCPACGPNEYFDYAGPINRRTCANMLEYTRDYSQNKEGCFCTNEHVYDTNIGVCVKPEDCSIHPQCTGDHQVYVENGNWKSCFNYKTGGSPRNTPACLCEDGYVFDIRVYPNKCIPISYCECGENEELSYSTCVRTCDNRQTGTCDIGNRMCACKNGYVYETLNSTKCIKEEDCPNPPVCPQPNQEFANGTSRFCPSGGLSSTYLYFYPGCFCKSGYVLNLTVNYAYQCIPTSQCPGVGCPANASLRVSSVDRTCNDIRTGVVPITNVTWYDCFCNEGYVRQDGDDKCILPEDCIKCGANEDVVYWSRCEDTCTTFNPTGCQNYSNINGTGCGCKPGYVYESTSSRTCVPVVSCPKPIDCGLNKVYKMNGTQDSCMTRNGQGYIIPMEAKSNNAVSTPVDSRIIFPPRPYRPDGPGCYCMEGYIYRDNFSPDCMLENTCPKCPNNTYYASQSGGCVQTCDDLHMSYTGQQNSKCRVTVEANTCQCSYPFVAKSDKEPECVDINTCSAFCTENEEFLETAMLQDCITYLNNFTNTYYGGQGCYCKKGYLRDMKSLECVPIDQCDRCSELEVYSPTNAEDTTCENWAILKNTFVDFTLTHIPENNGLIQGSCICKPGVARNCENECIPIWACPYPPPCGPNQLFQKFGEDIYCDGLDGSNQDSGPRCYCKCGYARNYKNECIPECECPNCEENDPNSYFSPCVHCYDYCNGTRVCKWNCLGDCDCKPGFVYDENNECIPSTGCKLITRDNRIIYPLVSEAGSAPAPAPINNPVPI